MLDTVICCDWPHVDEVLGQGDALAVPADGDGPVQVSRGVSVLAIGDSDHGSTYLPDETIVSVQTKSMKYDVDTTDGQSDTPHISNSAETL